MRIAGAVFRLDLACLFGRMIPNDRHDVRRNSDRGDRRTCPEVRGVCLAVCWWGSVFPLCEIGSPPPPGIYFSFPAGIRSPAANL